MVAEVDTWKINVTDRESLIESILADVRVRQGGTVFTINLDHLAKLRRDVAFGEAYRRARYVSADGAPVVVLARAMGADIERVTGADLVVPLSRAAASAGVPIYFFGTSEEVLSVAIERLHALVPGLVVAGREAPPMGFDPVGEDAAAAARRIAASGAGICFVALGAPKQELFADAATRSADGVIYLGVGAALDFIAGRRIRAPRLLQMMGLEWAWRTMQEPRRLIPRYFDSAMWLLRYVATLVFHGGSPAKRPEAKN
jgi:exopolysaccharide biosynthesis WecB/TagA/CpsF family protein